MNLLVLSLWTALAAPPPVQHSPIEAFLQRVQRTQAGQRPALIDEALRRRPETPWVEGRVVLFLAQGRDGEAPRLIGDFNSWGRMEDGPLGPAMKPIEGTPYFYSRGEFDARARLDYQFRYGDQSVPDPHNPHQWERWGEATSELRMSGFRPPTELKELPQVPSDRLTDLHFESKALQGKRHVYIYLPPGYHDSEERYPTVYLGDGDGWVEAMQTHQILESAIQDGRLPKLIAVFHQPQDRRAEYRGHPGHRRFLTQELVPWLDARFRTRPQADQRVIMGASRGGLMATDMALAHPEVFRLCAAMAPAIRPTELLEDLRQQSPSGVRFSVAYGTYDLRYVPDAIDLVKILKEKNWPVNALDFPQGHSIRAWRPVIDDLLRPLLAED